MRTLFLNIIVILTTLCQAHDGGNFTASDMLASMKPGDKAALLMVHFGTTHDDTRALTIDAINQKAKKTFPQMELREAYTSRIVMRRLKVRGMEKLTPTEALKKLKEDGFTHILIQSTNIIEGVEMESLRTEVTNAKSWFKDIRVSNPLLYNVKDYEDVISSLTKINPVNGSIVLVGHGTYTPSTATYAMMDYMLKAKGLKNYHVGTIEGYPSFDDMLTQLNVDGSKQVLLIPFMFVAGDHAKNDIATDWKEKLTQAGYEVSVLMEGLGQNPDIQNLFINHARFMLSHKIINIMDKKKRYAAEKD